MTLWRLTDHLFGFNGQEPTPDWSYYTWLATGETAQDAMRKVVKSIKEQNARYAGSKKAATKAASAEMSALIAKLYEPDPIPQVMWAAPFKMPDIEYMSAERSDIGEDFEQMFDYDAVVEVRL